MNDILYTVHVDGTDKKFKKGTTYQEIARTYQQEYQHDIVLVFVDGRLQELFKTLETDCELKFVTTADPLGYKSYRRSMSLMLVKAIYDVTEHKNIDKVRIHYSVSKGYYCTIEGNIDLTQEFLDRVESRMRAMVEMDLPIRKKSVHTDDAIAMFGQHGMHDKERLFHYRRVSRVNIYSLNEFEDYYYGYMVPSAGYLKYFKLYLYDEGFVIQMPVMNEPEAVPPFEPQNHLFRVLQESTKWGDIQGIETVGDLNDKITKSDVNELVLVQEALQEEKKTGLIRMGEYKYWATALAQIYQIEQKDHGETMDSQLASIYIRNLIRNSISDDIYYEAFYNPLGECILFGMNEPEEMEKILLKLNDIAKESKRVMKIKAAIGVGKIKDELIKVKESFEEAKEALSYRKMSQDGDVIYMEDIDKSEQVILLFDEKAQDKLFTAVKFGKEEDIHAVIRKMKEYLIKADMSSSSYQAYSMSVINALLVFARQQDLEIEEVFDGIPNYLEIMQKYASADTFMEWLEEQCIRLNANQGRERENKAKGIIEEAKQKIQEEFGDPDIGLEKIAAEVGLTQTYFSSLFKKETGMSFVEYLTDTRMKEAMRLLKETSEKIYVVAQKVGYLESGYFSHVFKKKYGMSPIQCRRQGQ